jgi:hypothetical protein
LRMGELDHSKTALRGSHAGAGNCAATQ